MQNRIRTFGVWAAVAVLLPAGLCAQAFDDADLPKTYEEPLAADAMGVTVHRLENGLTVYLSPNPEEPRVSARIVVRAGSAQDPDDATGMAHYLEHMLFKGSQRLGTLDYEQEKPSLERIDALYEELFKTADPAAREALYAEIDSESVKMSRFAVPNELDRLYSTLGIGGVNAFTSQDLTAYVSDFPANRLEAWAMAEGDRFASPVFRLFQTEIETVYEEKNRSMDDDDDLLAEALAQELYGAHPYGRPILGTVEHLKNPSMSKMRAFYETWYVPNNMAVVLAGDFDREDALHAIRRHMGAWVPAPLPSRTQGPPAALEGPRTAEVRYEAEEEVRIAWPTVSGSHPDRFALIVLDMLMDNSEAGLLNLEVNQAQKVRASGSYPDMDNQSGSWVLWAKPKKDQTLEEAETVVMQALLRLKQGAFEQSDIDAILKDFEIGEKRRLEGNAGRVAAMASAFARGQDWKDASSWIEQVRKVTKEDVLRAAETYLGETRVVAYRRKGAPETRTIAKPKFTPVTLDSGRESAFFKEVAALPARPMQPRWLEEGRDYVRLRTDWGTLVHARNPMNDLYSLSFDFQLGRQHLKHLCVALDLLELAGGGTLDAQAYKKRLYQLGTSMSFGCGERSASVSLGGLEGDLETHLELLRLRFEQPRLEPGTLEKMVQIEIGRRRDRKLDPGPVLSALREAVTRGAESAFLTDLSDEELAALKEEDLLGLVKGLFAYKRRAAYVGRIRDDEAVELLALGRAPYKDPPARRPRTYIAPERTQVFLTPRDMVQARIGVFTTDGVFEPHTDVDRILYSQYMDGGMHSVLFQELREARSLAYSTGGGHSEGSLPGDGNYVYGRVDSQADKAVEAADLLLQLMREPPYSQARFEESRRSVEESYRTERVSFRAVPGTILYWNDKGYDKDPRPERFEKILAYKLDDLKGFARRFKGRPFTVYVLGPKDRLDMKGLEALGAIQEKSVDELFPY